jgi:predicted NUDIX family phosphoesterase
MKHSEHIVAVPATLVMYRINGIVKLPEALAGSIVIKRRKSLLNDFNYRKVIPLTVFVCGSKVASFTRKLDHQHEALRGKVTVGIGGHFEVGDLIFDKSVLDLPGSLVQAAEREVQEEVIVGANIVNVTTLDVAVAADETITDRQYLALVTIVTLDAEDIKPNPVEDELDFFGWFTPEELLNVGGDANETWTMKICNILSTPT